MNKSAASILRLDKWVNGKPEISVHNNWFIVDRVGLDLGNVTRVKDLDGWILTKIVPNRYIIVTSPEGEEHDLGSGYRVDIDSRERVASEMVKLAEAILAGAKTIKYKGYTIEESGFNYYIKDPKGHRMEGGVPATVETAKKWIDMEIAENMYSRSRQSVTSADEKTETFKCPECGTGVLKNTGYCVKCKEKVKASSIKVAAAGPYTLLLQLQDDVRRGRLNDEHYLKNVGFGWGHTRGADYVFGDAGREIAYGLIGYASGRKSQEEVLDIIKHNLPQALIDNKAFEGLRGEQIETHNLWMQMMKDAR